MKHKRISSSTYQVIVLLYSVDVITQEYIRSELHPIRLFPNDVTCVIRATDLTWFKSVYDCNLRQQTKLQITIGGFLV